MNFLQAIPREEGYYATGARPNRNLNRGEIEAGPLCASRWDGWIEGALSRDPRSVLQPYVFSYLTWPNIKRLNGDTAKSWQSTRMILAVRWIPYRAVARLAWWKCGECTRRAKSTSISTTATRHIFRQSVCRIRLGCVFFSPKRAVRLHSFNLDGVRWQVSSRIDALCVRRAAADYWSGRCNAHILDRSNG
jgi:hypothetical protein